LFIGFLCNYSLTVGSYIGLLSGQLPVFSERPIWYVMVPGILVITLVWGRNFYCSWICPFGAVQEGLYHSLNLFQFSPSSAIKSRIARFRWPLAWLAAILAFIFNNGQIAAYEPFAVFFSASGNTAQWIMMIVIVLASIAQMRFWCGSFCPVGLILQLLACARRKARRLLGQKRTKKEEQEIVSSCQVCSNPDCPTPARIAQERYSIQDKIFIGTAIIVNLLIIGTLLQNILFVLQNEALNTFFWSQEFIQMK
jgi:polyferredoxin